MRGGNKGERGHRGEARSLGPASKKDKRVDGRALFTGRAEGGGRGRKKK